MGFRSVIVATTYGIDWPEWIKEKYSDHIRFGAVTSSIAEAKHYGALADLPGDIQKVLKEKQHIVMVYLHDCTGISICSITPEIILWEEPSDLFVVEEITHDEGDGCDWQELKEKDPDAAKIESMADSYMVELENRIKNRELVNRHMAEEIERLRKRISELAAKKD